MLVTIPAGSALSNSFDIGVDDENEPAMFHVLISSGIWTSATLGVQVSKDNETFYPIQDTSGYPGVSPSSTEILTFDAPRYRFYKLWSHNSGTNVTQANTIVINMDVY